MPPSHPARADLPALTSLRFFAAAMIFAFHVREFYAYAWARELAPSLYQGVSFFFVLSGFVLTHAYAGRAFDRREFYVARLARVAPLHLVVMAGLALAPLPYSPAAPLGAGGAVASFFWKAALLDAWTPVPLAMFTWNTVTWSLSVEMAFYAIFPWLLPAVTRQPALTLAGAALTAMAVVTFGAIAGLPPSSANPGTLTLLNLGSSLPLARGFEFTLGIATALAWRRWVQPARWSCAMWTALEAAALLGALIWLFVLAPPLLSGAKGLAFPILRASGSCLVFALLIAALAAGRGGVGFLLSTRPLVALGQASFAFYLVHFIVLRTLRETSGVDAGPIFALALSLTLALALHRWLETPLRRLCLAIACDTARDTQSRSVDRGLSSAR